MKDIHSHLLFGIDDGCSTLDESIQTLIQAEKDGITELVITPHYVVNSEYNCNNKKKKKLFNQLVKEAQKAKIKIKLYLGNEVYISDNLLELLKDKEVSTINDSKYLLIEFPFSNMFQNTKEILYDLIVEGYVPIIAHPERYRVFQRHAQHMEEYLRMGVLLQGNYKSLFGKYGREAKKTLKFFLKKGWITFLGSDTHHADDFQIKKLDKKLKSLVKDKDVIHELLEDNFDKVIQNADFGIRR